MSHSVDLALLTESTVDERKPPPWLDGMEGDAYAAFNSWHDWMGRYFGGDFLAGVDEGQAANLYFVMARLWVNHPSLRAAGKGVAR